MTRLLAILIAVLAGVLMFGKVHGQAPGHYEKVRCYADGHCDYVFVVDAPQVSLALPPAKDAPKPLPVAPLGSPTLALPPVFETAEPERDERHQPFRDLIRRVLSAPRKIFAGRCQCGCGQRGCNCGK